METPRLPERDAEYFQELQTRTGWGRTLDSFAHWCDPERGWVTLDVGCGPGLLPAIFSEIGCTAVGVDLDLQMFRPAPLHQNAAVADVYRLPCRGAVFSLVTCSNLLFMLSDPVAAMVEMSRLLIHGGKMALLNPSEVLDVQAAQEFADKRQLEGIARATLLNWAERAEQNHRWTENETERLYHQAGLDYRGSDLKIGPGFARFSWGLR